MQGSFSFGIYDDDLDYAEISTLLQTTPSSINKKGEQLRLGNSVAPYDSWHLQEKFQESAMVEAAFNRLLQQLTPYTEEIAYLKQKYQQVTLNAYLRSSIFLRKRCSSWRRHGLVLEFIFFLLAE